MVTETAVNVWTASGRSKGEGEVLREGEWTFGRLRVPRSVEGALFPGY